MPKVLTKPTSAAEGVQVRVWYDPATMRKLKATGELVMFGKKKMFTDEYEMQLWKILDRATGDVSYSWIMVRIADGAVATPEMLEGRP